MEGDDCDGGGAGDGGDCDGDDGDAGGEALWDYDNDDDVGDEINDGGDGGEYDHTKISPSP